MAYPNDGDPMSVQVIEALQTRLETITGSGYHHDVQRVLTYDGASLQTDALPCIGILPTGHTSLGELTCDQRRWSAQFLLVVVLDHVQGSNDWKTEIAFIVTDIEVALRIPDDNLGGLTNEITIEGIDIDDAHPQEGLVFGSVSISINYDYSTTNPST